MENYRNYTERVEFYKSFGYDIEKERNFIMEKSEPIYGDILEVGTGKGYFTVALAKASYSFISIDISDEDQNVAREHIKQLHLEKCVDFKIENAEHLSFGDGIFDIVFSINTVHHLTKPFMVIDEAIRVLSFEGKIILVDFTKEGLELMNRTHASEGRKHEAGTISLRDIEGYLSNKGLKVEKDRSTFQELLIAYRQNI